MRQARTRVGTAPPEERRAVPVGQPPPLGEVPPSMHAWTLRSDRLGEPREAFRRELLATPEVGPHEVLVLVMAAGVNYNGVWAARGYPVDVIAMRLARGDDRDPFLVVGSDASGIVYRVGSAVTAVAVGDEVVLYAGQWDPACPHVRSGGDPVLSPSYRVWGYESNWGAFAQFTRVQEHQCRPKPRHMSWEEAACFGSAAASAYRMLHSFPEHSVRPGDVVLVWGGAGGLGSMAIQLAAQAGARPVAVTSSREKFEFCRRMGAVGCIDRMQFDHWGLLPRWDDSAAYGRWLEGARAFGRALWDTVGEQVSPRLVIEHPGADTLPTSLFVCAPAGMVVLCGGTSGYNGTLDLRYLWVRQKRLQGSHGYAEVEIDRLHTLAQRGALNPGLAATVPFEDLAQAHQRMHRNLHPFGNLAVLVGAPRPGLGSTEAVS